MRDMDEETALHAAICHYFIWKAAQLTTAEQGGTDAVAPHVSGDEKMPASKKPSKGAPTAAAAASTKKKKKKQKKSSMGSVFTQISELLLESVPGLASLRPRMPTNVRPFLAIRFQLYPQLHQDLMGANAEIQSLRFHLADLQYALHFAKTTGAAAAAAAAAHRHSAHLHAAHGGMGPPSVGPPHGPHPATLPPPTGLAAPPTDPLGMSNQNKRKSPPQEASAAALPPPGTPAPPPNKKRARDGNANSNNNNKDSASPETSLPPPPPQKTAAARLWDERIALLQQFYQQHGHFNVPRRENKLVHWVLDLRENYRKLQRLQQQLTTEQIAQLDEMGFDWNNPKKSQAARIWDERMAELEQFHAEHGHLRDPHHPKKLALWVSDVRKHYHTLQQLSEEERHEQLSCGGGGQDDDDDDKKKQPKPITRGSHLTYERLEKLNAMGFEWKPPNTRLSWEDRYQQLIDYKQKHGHLMIRRSTNDPAGLGEYVHGLRKQYRKKTPLIMGEREEKLNAIGFIWESDFRPTCFEQRLEECRRFVEKHGHLEVPPPPVRQSKQRRKKKTTTSTTREQNEKKNDEGDDENDNAQTNGIHLIVEAALSKKSGEKDNGDENEQQDHGEDKQLSTSDDDPAQQQQEEEENEGPQPPPAFGRAEKSFQAWAERQRKNYKLFQQGKKSTLDEDRIQKLNQLGFCWSTPKLQDSTTTTTTPMTMIAMI